MTSGNGHTPSLRSPDQCPALMNDRGCGRKRSLAILGDPTVARKPLPSSQQVLRTSATMKCLAISLALVLFTGSHASVLRDQPESKLDQLRGEFKEHLVNFSKTVNKELDLIAREEFFNQLKEQISANYFQLRESLYDLGQALPEETKQVYRMVLEVSWGLWNSTLKTLHEARGEPSSATEEIVEILLSASRPYVDPVLQRVDPYPEGLHRALGTALGALNARLNETLPRRLEDLGAQLGPYAKEAQRQTEELRASFRPVAEQVKQGFLQGLATVTRSLKPYMAPFLEALQAPVKQREVA